MIKRLISWIFPKKTILPRKVYEFTKHNEILDELLKEK